MSKLNKCLYLINLLQRRGPMSLEEINEHFRFSTLYDGDFHPRTFARYKDFILENFPCEIEYDPAIRKYQLIQSVTMISFLPVTYIMLKFVGISPVAPFVILPIFA